MSVYIKENPKYLDEALYSLYRDQTLKPKEIILIKDGLLNDSLNKIINKHKKLLSGVLCVYGYDKNQGLGYALNFGLSKCSYELVARFDSDDICMPYRFEYQIREFNLNKNLTICGTQIIEFEGQLERKRLVPESHVSILNRIRYSSPFNHVTVMFRKTKVLECGSYKDFKNYEDYYLWIRLLSNKNNFSKNINYVGVKVRIQGLEERRRGLKYLITEFNIFKQVYSYGYSNAYQFLFRILIAILIRFLPRNILRKIYLLKSKILK